MKKKHIATIFFQEKRIFIIIILAEAYIMGNKYNRFFENLPNMNIKKAARAVGNANTTIP